MRGLLALAAKLAISVVLLAWALGRVDIGLLGSRLRQAEPAWLAALLLALAVQATLVALRWRRVGLHCAAPFSVGQALRYTFTALFFNQTLPSTVGGDAARVWLAARAGAGWKAAVYSVLVDRVVGLAVLVALVLASLPWLLARVGDPLGRASILLLDGVGALAIVAFLLLGHAAWRWPQRWWLTRHVAGAAALAWRVLSRAGSGGAVVGLSLAIHLLTVLAAWCAARAVAAPLDFAQAVLLVPPVILVATIPISIAGWGVREGAMMAVFGYAGLSAADGLIVSLLFGAGAFALGGAGGVVWIADGAQRIWSDRARAS